MLQQDKPDDYVVATGETHTVREFIGWVEEETGKKMKVIIDPAYIRPAEVEILCGNPKKAQDALGWTPKIKGKDIVKFMLKNDLPNTTK
jgi:GDPmannose 4,6-dehydratase